MKIAYTTFEAPSVIKEYKKCLKVISVCKLKEALKLKFTNKYLYLMFKKGV